MKFDTDQHHRRSLRLQGYDYAQAGAYFVTICTQNRACLFGEIVDEKMRVNDVGRMVERWWEKLPEKFPATEIDEFIIMPNHLHGIVVLVGAAPCGRPGGVAVADASGLARARLKAGHPHGGAPTLGDIMSWFKTMTTNDYLRGVKQRGWTSFPGKLWQRNYYEHIIRDDAALDRIRQYIAENPLRWATDDENLQRER